MGQPVILIHGMWCTGAVFDRVASLLRPRGYDCYAPTLPAHELGVRHPEVGSLSLNDYLAFLENYVRQQNFSQPPIILGHSMGGLLAQMLTTRIGALALVLLTPASPAGVNAITPASLAAFWKSLIRPGFWKLPHKPAFSRACRSVFPGLPTERHQELYDGMVEESGRVLGEIAYWLLDPGKASRIQPAAVQCPVYVVSGGLDRLTPASVVRKVAALYPGSTRRHWPERGHWVIDDSETENMVHEIVGWLQPFQMRAARGQPIRR